MPTPTGPDNGKARFTREQVQELRRRWGGYGGSLRDFARREKLPYSTARNVIYGITYDSVPVSQTNTQS